MKLNHVGRQPYRRRVIRFLLRKGSTPTIGGCICITWYKSTVDFQLQSPLFLFKCVIMLPMSHDKYFSIQRRLLSPCLLKLSTPTKLSNEMRTFLFVRVLKILEENSNSLQPWKDFQMIQVTDCGSGQCIYPKRRRHVFEGSYITLHSIIRWSWRVYQPFWYVCPHPSQLAIASVFLTDIQGKASCKLSKQWPLP